MMSPLLSENELIKDGIMLIQVFKLLSGEESAKKKLSHNHMRDNQIYAEALIKTHNAGWRVQHNLGRGKQYYKNGQTQKRSDTFPTGEDSVNQPNTILTCFGFKLISCHMLNT